MAEKSDFTWINSVQQNEKTSFDVTATFRLNIFMFPDA